MNKRNGLMVITLLAALCVSGLSAARGAVQTRGKEHHVARSEHIGRKGEAKITMKQARAAALAQVPGGRIKSSELERENNRLIHSFDIRAAGDIKEVHVDALDGKVLEVKTESRAGEAAERRQDKRESKHRRQR